jgi:hypothetical protein
MTACKVLDDFIDVRLFREENQDWIEKAVITRIWAGTTGPDAENSLDTLQDLFENVGREMKYPLSPPATHAAQTVSDGDQIRPIDIQVWLTRFRLI